jgi:drug/metabolite transporter (DMT)-like permease
MRGVLWAALAGVSFGLFQAVNRRVSRELDNYVATFILLVLSVVALGAAALLTQDLDLLWDAPPSALGWFALAGFFHFFLGWTLLGLSQRTVGAARTGVLIGTTPLWGTAIAFVVLREFVRPTALAGVALVVTGIFLLSLARGSGPTDAAPGSGLDLSYGLLTAVCWGLSPVFVRFGLEQVPAPLIGVTVGMAASAAAYGGALLRRGHRAAVARSAWGGLAIAGALVALGIGSLWTALDLAPVAIVLALNQLAVLTVILTSPLIVGGAAEKLTWRTGAGGFLVLAGTLLIIFARGPALS